MDTWLQAENMVFSYTTLVLPLNSTKLPFEFSDVVMISK